MPRLNRVRIHNIHFDSGGQSRVFHDTVFEPRGNNSLLLLANGGGKTLLLHLIAQVVIPNTRLQERRISRLLNREKFTGHVLVEWALDGDVPRFLLTGFCFAENLGSANRDMDYYSYIYEYAGSNSWDMASIPLADVNGRNLNFKQLYDILKDSPVTVFHSYRHQEYQEKLKTYNIDPREWKYILQINNSEGGVEDFFEGCSKTRTLMNKLVIPMIDEVLDRREERDMLQDAFRKVARQVIDLPELEVQSDALTALSGIIPRLQSTFNDVGQAVQQKEEINIHRSRIYNTLNKGLPRLEKEYRKLEKEVDGKINELDNTRFLLDALAVEEKRRAWAELQKQGQKTEDINKAALKRRELEQQRHNRFRANQKWESIVGKKRRLEEYEQELEKARLGDSSFLKRFEELKKEVLPLLERSIHAHGQQETAGKDELKNCLREKDRVKKESEKVLNVLQDLKKKIYHLKEKQKDFETARQKTAERFLKLNVPFDTFDPVKASQKIQWETDKAAAGEKAKNTQIQKAEKARKEIQERFYLIQGDGEKTGRELEEMKELHRDWQDDGQVLRADLKNLGFNRNFPEDSRSAQAWLGQKEKKNAEDRIELQQEQRRREEQELLFSGSGSPRPNAEIDRVTQMLRVEKLAAQPAADLMKDYSEEQRQEMLRSRPWLPYAVVVETSQLAALKNRNTIFPGELSVPVPLISREVFYGGAAPADVYFLSHRGLELFVSAEKADAYRKKIKDSLDEIREKLNKLEEESGAVRRGREGTALFLGKYTHSSRDEWEKALRDKENTLDKQKLEKGKLQKQIDEHGDMLDALQGELENLKAAKTNLEKALEWGNDYCGAWNDHKKEAGNLNGLLRQEEEYEKKQTLLQEEEYEQDKLIQHLKEKIKSLQDKLADYHKFRSAYFPGGEIKALPDSSPALNTGEEQHFKELTEKIAAMDRTLQEKEKSFRDLTDSIKDLKEDIIRLKQDISNLGFDPAEVEKEYHAVTQEDIEKAGVAAADAEEAFKKAEKEHRDTEDKIREAGAVHNYSREKLEEDYPGRKAPPGLSGADLIMEKARITELSAALMEARKTLQKEKEQCQKRIDDYKRAGSVLEQAAATEPFTGADPFTGDEEKRYLMGRALEAVEESRLESEKAGAAVARHKDDAVAVLEACEEELVKLHGDTIKRFFHSLKTRTTEKGWENKVEELKGKLDHALEAISRLQEHVRQQLSNIDKRMEEMTLRIWRHTDSLLEQIRELHGRAGITLRGEKLNLFKIEFKKPNETESLGTIRDYLEKIVKEATRMYHRGEDEEAVNSFLDDRVRSAELLDRVVPLDSINIRLLKPGDYEGSYLNKQYDRWDDLSDWSQGQRFAGRFSLFVVLLSYLRHSRTGGYKSSAVILADNPFGKASSSHILEIVNAITHHQNVQLFCCTALRNTEIMREFPVIYSLVPVATMSGKERMQLETHRGETSRALEQAYAHIPGIKPGDTGQLKIF